MAASKSTFQVLQLSGDLDNPWLASTAPWVPTDTFMIRADMITRGDFLAMSPQYARVQYAIPFGTRMQISTREYGSMILPGNLLVMINRVEGADNV